MRVLAVLALAGCPSSDDAGTVPDGDDDDTDVVDTDTGDTDTTPPETGETATDTGTPPTGYARPTVLEVVCDPTDNELRFECTVTIDPAQPVQLTFVRDDGLSMTRTVDGPDALAEHVLPMYFMAPSQTYDVSVIATDWPDDGVAITVTTNAAPAIVDSSMTVTGTSTMGLVGTHHPCSSDAVAVAYDTATGDLMWYQLFDINGTFGALDMVAFTEDFTVLGETQGSVIEVDLMGEDVVRLPGLSGLLGVTAGGAFGNFHHDIMKRNGIYYVIYQEQMGGSPFFPDVLDALILFDETGTELAQWHALDHLPIPGNWDGDYLHTNTVYVDELGDIYLSFLTQDMIVKLDGDLASPTFGDPIWALDGNVGGGLSGTITTDWSAVGNPSNFNNQHSLITRADGRVQLLDNSSGRGLVISVDELTSTATVDAEFETRENSCGVQGTSRATVAGNPVVGCLGYSLREYDITSEAMLWEGTVQCATGGGPFLGSARFYPLDGW